MATAGGAAVDGGDMMRYAEYTPKTNVRSDAEIDRRLVRMCFRTEHICRVCQTAQNSSVLLFLPPRVCVR